METSSWSWSRGMAWLQMERQRTSFTTCGWRWSDTSSGCWGANCKESSTIAFTRWPQKIATSILYVLTLPNINRFSELFYCQSQKKIRNNTINKDPTTPQVCRCESWKHWSVASPVWVRRPAARRTHWRFDVKPAGCDKLRPSLDNNWDT